MNLFWNKLFGNLVSTSKYEANEKKLLEAMHRYDEVGKSIELEEYKSLFNIVKSSKFQENKKILQNRKYKDTEEYRHFKKLHKLEANSDIKRYFHVLNSDILRQYLAFKSTPEFELLRNKKKVAASKQLQQLKNFERSKSYKCYVRFHNSYIIKELEDLQTKTATPEFIKSNRFWADNQRWHSTPEYAQEQRYYQLAKNQDIVFYENQNPDAFKRIRALKRTFYQKFDRNTLDKSYWTFGFHYKSPELIEQHSFANEKQAYNKGKNTIAEDGILKVYTKSENITARAWDAKKGFIDKEFNFTSDVLQTADSFRQKEGIFSVKIRCTGKINHACWLGADGKLPHVNIFHFDGKQITLGNAHKDIVDGINITGISPSDFYIYTLAWTKKELIWSINNMEVYRTTNQIPQEDLYLAINSFIPEKQNGTTGSMEIDWIKVYQRS
jgi:Beta-glucanase/Beta-glucan synthetase